MWTGVYQTSGEITAVYKNEILAHLLQIGAIWERNGAQ